MIWRLTLRFAVLSLSLHFLFAGFLLLSHPALAKVSQDGLRPEDLAAQAKTQNLGDEPDTGALRTALEPVLVTSTVPVMEAPRPSLGASEQGQGVPELSFEELARLMVQAISGKSWSLLASLLLVGLVMVSRKLGGKVLPWLDTPKGAVLLSVVGGTFTLLSVALGQGQPFTFGLLVSCLMGAASAAGLWSWGQTVRGGKMKPSVAPVCLPEEVANGKCKV